MSTISDALKTAKQIRYLIELDFDGLVVRISTHGVQLSDRFFSAKILNEISVTQIFNFANWSYSAGNVYVEMANDGRMQDHETTRRLDGGTGNVYIWCPGLTWAQIETDGLIFSGTFEKSYHTKERYTFRLVDKSLDRFQQIPPVTISDDTWSAHRTEGGGGSVSGKPEALVFGDWAKGVPLLCVDTAGFKYIAGAGPLKSVEADYNAGTVDVYDEAGAVIAPAGYTLSYGTDGQGNPVALFDFDADKVDSEPLSCSISGITDGSGEFVGTAAALIEHPAEIVHYIISKYSAAATDVQSIKTMKNILPGLKFTTLINKTANGADVVKRLLGQCLCARCQRPGGQVGIMTLSSDVPNVGRLTRDIDTIGQRVRISKTDANLIANNLTVNYDFNPTQKKYEGQLSRNWTNNPYCAKSYHEYGERPARVVNLTDVSDEPTAVAIANRHIDIFSQRHDVVEQDVPIWLGFDTVEGDGGLLTLPEGPGGWTNEEFILIERGFSGRTITQKWWRIAA